MKSIAFIIALVTIAVEAGTNKTLAPTPGVTRPPDTEPPVATQPPITPFPTEATIDTPPPVEVPETPPPVVAPTPTYTVSFYSCWFAFCPIIDCLEDTQRNDIRLVGFIEHFSVLSIATLDARTRMNKRTSSLESL
jgi:hypothetical protein